MKASVDTIMTAGAAGFTLVFGLILALTFSIKVETEATFSRTCDPGYPFLLALAMHTVNGEPFLEALSESLVSGNTDEVQAELGKFGESFRLINREKETILSMGETKDRSAVLAVPPGGKLVVMYER